MLKHFSVILLILLFQMTTQKTDNLLMESIKTEAVQEDVTKLGAGGGDDGGGDAAHADHAIEYLFIFIIFGLMIGMFLYWIKALTSIPYTPMLLIVGIILGYFYKSLWVFGESIDHVIKIDAHTLLLVFIPPLIFESAFNADTFIFIKSKYQILLLALPGVALGSVLIAITLMYILGYRKDESNPNSTVFNWAESLTLGAICAATDPVAVVALLKELGTSLRFNMLLEGESLFNDGTAVVFFWVFMAYIEKGEFIFSDFILTFIRLSIGGPILGLVVGVISLPILKRLVNNTKILVLMTFFVAYLTFYLAESAFFKIRVSGILALVILGLYLGDKMRSRLLHQQEETLEAVWKFASFILETLLFLLTGLYLGEFFINDDPNGVTVGWADFGKLIAFNIIVILIRGLVNCILWPLLNLVGYTIDWKAILIMTYGGLRGAIGLSLALFVATSHSDAIIAKFKVLTVFYVAGTITFTVLINGLTIKYVMKAIKFIKKDHMQSKMKIKVKEVLLLHTFNKMEDIKAYPWLSKANWKKVEEILDFKKKTREITSAAIQFKSVGMENKIRKYDQVIFGLETLIKYKKNKPVSVRSRRSFNKIETQVKAEDEDSRNEEDLLDLSKEKEELNVEEEKEGNSAKEEIEDKETENDVEKEDDKRESKNDLEFSHDPNFMTNKESKLGSRKVDGEKEHLKASSRKEGTSTTNLGSKYDRKSRHVIKESHLSDIEEDEEYATNETKVKKKAMKRKKTIMGHEDMESQNNPEEITKELRFKVYKMVIAMIYERYENNLCLFKTFKLSKKLCDLGRDKIHIPFSLYRYYKKYYVGLVWFKFYNTFSNMPSFIGKYFRRKIFSQYYYNYDILSTIVLVLEDIKDDKESIIFKMFEKQKKRIMEEIDAEIQTVKNKILEFPDDYSSAIQTRKAVSVLLNFEKKHINKLMIKGVIDKKMSEELEGDIKKSHLRIKKYESLDDIKNKTQGPTSHLKFLFPTLFSLGENELGHIQNSITENVYNEGDILYNIGEEPTTVYMLETGAVNMRRQDGKIAKMNVERDIVGLENIISNTETNTAKAIVVEKTKVFEVDINVIKNCANDVPEFKKHCVIEASYYQIKTTTVVESEGKTDFYNNLVKIKSSRLFEVLRGSKHFSLEEVDKEISTSSAIYIFRGAIKYKFLGRKGDGNFHELLVDDAISIGNKIIVATEPNTYILELDVSSCFKKKEEKKKEEDHD